jgi:hypothetical protein
LTYNLTQSNWFVPPTLAALHEKPPPQSELLQQVSEQ